MIQVVIGYAHIIKLSTEEYLKLKSGEELIYSFKRNGEDCYGGDFIRIEEERDNGLEGEKRDYEVVRSVYDKETDMYTVKLRIDTGDLALL